MEVNERIHLNIKLETMEWTFNEDVFRRGGTGKETYFLSIKSVKRLEWPLGTKEEEETI